MSAQGLDRTLAALADPHRRQVVDLLRERPHRAGELAQAARHDFPEPVTLQRVADWWRASLGALREHVR